MLKNAEKNEENKNGSEKTTRASTRLKNARLENFEAVIGGGDRNSNYEASEPQGD